ncbi:uncharacterized protein L3040_008803 [Drepanopeziza brunnea f. sp. 'multigermtubi']|uniref:uncharacterized protein n=1 Tax=Drepanopeziza brunnea f. sp. 'multigermtubi' TaxID=698441 RepID=UPI0023A20593|nr:hypothetical protein L3040_008803 [Drepanopeziza brunnea f. sp. 'multigermtubi']
MFKKFKQSISKENHAKRSLSPRDVKVSSESDDGELPPLVKASPVCKAKGQLNSYSTVDYLLVLGPDAVCFTPLWSC